MSDYLKNLQESVLLTESFLKVRTPTVIMKEELLEELKDVLDEEDINLISDFGILSELDIGYTYQKIKDLTGLRTNLKYKLSRFSGDKSSEAYKSITDKLAAIEDKLSTWKDAAVKGGKEIAHDVTKDVSKAVTKVGEKTVEFAKDHPGAIGATAAVLSAIAGALIVYKKYYSKAAQACKDATEKDVCLKQYKLKAKQAQIVDLSTRGKLKCDASKKPDACHEKLARKIAKLRLSIKQY